MMQAEKAKGLPKLCNFVAAGKECTFPEGKCRFSHDRETYLKRKPKDISDQCPLINSVGTCRWGISCRFYSGHPNTDTCKVIEPSNPEYGKVHNEFSKTFIHTIRKKKKRIYERYVNVPDVVKCHNAFKQQKSIDSPYMKIFNLNEKYDKKPLDFKGKTYLAPLTTCGNLPFRRICKDFGCDITCSEMAMCSKLLDGIAGEWALLQRHPSEDLFGVQILTGHIDEMAMTTTLINENINCDFIDLNVGCPLDNVCQTGRGAGLMRAKNNRRLRHLVRTMSALSNVPITCKLRIGFSHSKPVAKQWVSDLINDGVSAIGLHGRSRQQRYRRPADWDYIKEVSQVENVPLIGNGDIYTYEEWDAHMKKTDCDTLMLGRGALIKPWIFTEIKEKRHWDISAKERLDIVKKFADYGLEQWGCDIRGVNNTRRFLLEWLSFGHRYIPVGVLERPVKIGDRPPYYVGRNDLETLLASGNVNDWLKITEMFLGPVDQSFEFVPKHKASSWAVDAETIIDALGRETSATTQASKAAVLSGAKVV